MLGGTFEHFTNYNACPARKAVRSLKVVIMRYLSQVNEQPSSTVKGFFMQEAALAEKDVETFSLFSCLQG